MHCESNGEDVNSIRKIDSATSSADPRALRIMAKSLYREMRSAGHSRGDIVLFTSALLELMTDEGEAIITAEAAE